MRQIAIVFKFELRELFRQKSIVITPIVFALIFFVATFIPRFLPSATLAPSFDADGIPIEEDSYFSEDDNFGVYIASPTIDAEQLQNYPIYNEATFYSDEAELIVDYESDNLNYALVLSEVDGATTGTLHLHDIGMDTSLVSQLTAILQEYQKNDYLLEQEIDPIEFQIQTERPIYFTMESDGRNAITGYAFSYAGIFLLYFVIIMSGSIVATNVAREKSSRTMELLITQVSAKNLILGKVTALTVMTLYEILLIILGIGAGYLINKPFFPEGIVQLIDTGISPTAILLYVLFGLVGCILYYFLYAAVGSLVDRVEDVSSAMGSIMVIFVVAFMATMFSMMSPESTIMRILSFIPFSSPFALIARYLMVSMPLTEILISFAILLASTVLIAYVAIRIYREGTLNYGQKLSLFQAFKRSQQES